MPKDSFRQPKPCWSDVLWSDEMMVELFSLNFRIYVWHKANTEHYPKDSIPIVKRGGDSIRL